MPALPGLFLCHHILVAWQGQSLPAAPHWGQLCSAATPGPSGWNPQLCSFPLPVPAPFTFSLMPPFLTSTKTTQEIQQPTWQHPHHSKAVDEGKRQRQEPCPEPWHEQQPSQGPCNPQGPAPPSLGLSLATHPSFHRYMHQDTGVLSPPRKPWMPPASPRPR